MCGICGYISSKEINIMELKDMNNQMEHRGPDDSGAEIYNWHDISIGFAQRRLSINDLSAQGHQPMHSVDGKISVVFNGEIYNFKELKDELGEYSFCSKTDTEVIIAAYLKWGIYFVEKLNGMYAIALFDRDAGNVYLIRDRVGKKPLYYFLSEEAIIFASELKPIMSCSLFEKRIRKNIIPRYLYQGYINAPETIFDNVFKLNPGSIIEISISDKHPIVLEEWYYWNMDSVYMTESENNFRSYKEAKQAVKQAIINAVKRRLIGDVPIGAFLSGGIDSSLVTAVAQEISGGDLETFCIGFEDKNLNEAEFARNVAKAIGTRHKEFIITEREMLGLVSSIPKYFDEPFADPSQIPTMLVSKLARENVTVVLTGDGGDEFFCGYRIYDSVAIAQRTDKIGALLWRFSRTDAGNKIFDKMPEQIRMVMANRDNSAKVQFSPQILENASLGFMRGKDQETEGFYVPCKYKENNHKNWRQRRMLLDMSTYLPGDILCKTDRASMRYSLEARCPLLDREVIQASFRVPMKYQCPRGDKKHILKDIAYEYVPKKLLERPKKGFSVPWKNWLQGPLRDMLLDYSDKAYLENQGLFDTKFVNSFIRDYIGKIFSNRVQEEVSRLVWSFLMFQIWDNFYKNDIL